MEQYCLRCKGVYDFFMDEKGRPICRNCELPPPHGWVTDGKKASYEPVYNWRDTYPNRRKE